MLVSMNTALQRLSHLLMPPPKPRQHRDSTCSFHWHLENRLVWGAVAPLPTFTLCALRTHQPCGSLYNTPTSGAIQPAANMSTMEQQGMFYGPLGSPDAAVLMPVVTLQIKPNPEQHNVPATAQHRQAPSLGLLAACSGYGQQVPVMSSSPGAPTGGSCQLPWLPFTIFKKV